MAQEGREEASRQRALAREKEWMAASPKARQTKSKARIKSYDELAQTQRRARSGYWHKSSFQLVNVLVMWSSRLKVCKKGFGDRMLIDGLDFNLPPGGIVGVIGPNGVGKSTLFKMLTGDETA